MQIMLSKIFILVATTVSLGVSEPNPLREIVSAGQPRQIFQFGNLVEIESLTVRANGDLLVTTPSPSAEIWQLDPTAFNGSARHVASLNSSSALGILEIGEDVFAVTNGKVVSGPKGVAGSFSLQILKVAGAQNYNATIISHITVPEAGFLNKLASLQPHSDTILASDSNKGVVYAINTTSGSVQIVLQDAETMSPDTTVFPVGINGIQRVGSYLYYVNSSKGLLNRVRLRHNGTAAGPYETIANFSSTLSLPDDFAILPNGEAFIAGSNQIAHVRPNGLFTILAGGVNDRILAGATSARFGRGTASRTLYITSSGHISSPANITFVEPGKVMEIEINEH
ncbi:Putative hetero-Diels-Alderase-like protein [Cladobotryum mycophilum]|uniref:Hetero-Diels-Alderase-like protein n=1 Tax=Cladobotryum mycophilum TaxID=491253 RepID=A0ABR0SW39_9HYPO